MPARHETARQRQLNAHIARKRGPLVNARAALDRAYYATRIELEESIASGVSLENAMDSAPAEPQEKEARNLLRPVPQNVSSWMEWFNLRATMASREMRLFLSASFVDEASNRIVRQELVSRAYNAYGSLLAEALDVHAAIPVEESDAKGQFKGTLSELTVLTDGNDVEDGSSAMMLSTVIADHYNKIDSRFKYFPEAGRGPRSVRVQIKTATAGKQWERAALEAAHIVPVVANDFFASPDGALWGARLLARDVQGGLDLTESADLRDRSNSMRAYIIQTSEQWYDFEAHDELPFESRTQPEPYIPPPPAAATPTGLSWLQAQTNRS